MFCTIAHPAGEYCHDQATPAQRDAFARLYGHAFDWAHGGDRGIAEDYAAYFAAAYFADPDDAPAHPAEFERWEATTG